MIANHKFFHWLYYHQKKNHYFNIGAGLFIWLFLALTQPFGIYNNNISNHILLLLFLLPFGLVWTVISYMTDYIIQYGSTIAVRENHKIDFKFFLLKIFILIHGYFGIRNFFCDWLCIDFYEYLELWFACLFMLSVVYIPFSLYARYKFFHKMVGEENNDSKGLFELKGDGKNLLKVSLDRVLYFKADDNYVDIMTLGQNNKQETLVFRTSLKSLAEQLKEHSQFIRVHRSFIINLRYKRNLDKKDSINIGNDETQIEVPVSKKYKEELLKLIK